MENKIAKLSLTFLKELKDNNNREWFKTNKLKYDESRQSIAGFADYIISELNKTDVLENESGSKSLFRIYKDVRFSKDKTPYNTHWSAAFSRATPQRRGSYYFKIMPGGQSIVGGGFYGPEPKDMKLIRSHIAQEPNRLRKIIESPDFINAFENLKGEQVKSAPRGFSKDDPAIDLIIYKQFIAFKTFTDQEVLADDFPQKALLILLAIRPFFDYMSEILTTNLNGESLIE